MLRFTESPIAVGGMTDTVDLYRVKVNGVECAVHKARVSAIPFNRPWPGYQRPVEQSELAAFVCFEANESVVMEVQCDKVFEKATIRPLSRNVSVRVNGSNVTFTLDKPGQYVLELDDEHGALHIFVNDVTEYEDSQKATYYFGPGVHFPGLVKLNSNESVYVDRGAIVYGSIYGERVSNIRIFGHGIIDGSYEERIVEHCYKSYTKGNIKFYDSEDISIDGVILRNSAIWSLNLFHCVNVDVNNVKIVGQWRYNTDGMDICNCQNVHIKNSFIRAFADVISIKSIPEYKDIPVKNIIIQNCIMWCGWGRNAELGIETISPEFVDISFIDCDLIHSSASCMDIQNGGFADVHNVVFENINVEYQSTCLPEIFQESDEQIYDPKGLIGMPFLIYSDNIKFLENEINNRYGTTYDILYKNINVYLDEGLPMPKICFNNRTGAVLHRGFTIDGLYVNGKKIENLSEMDFHVDGCVENIELK